MRISYFVDNHSPSYGGPYTVISEQLKYLYKNNIKVELIYNSNSFTNFNRDYNSIIEDMASRGHEINYPVSPIGGGQIILIDIKKNILIGASDFRKDGCAIGY